MSNECFIKPNSKNYIGLTVGNLCIKYLQNQQMYLLEKIDGNIFDETSESIETINYDNNRIRLSFEETIGYMVESFIPLQTNEESKMFDTVYWRYNENQTKIYIQPVLDYSNCNEVLKVIQLPDGQQLEVKPLRRVKTINQNNKQL